MNLNNKITFRAWYGSNELFSASNLRKACHTQHQITDTTTDKAAITATANHTAF